MHLPCIEMLLYPRSHFNAVSVPDPPLHHPSFHFCTPSSPLLLSFLGPLGALSSDVTTLRTLIATLKTGVHFVRSLLAALPAVRRLLGGGGASGGSVDVIKEAIALLAMCRQVTAGDML